MIGEISVHTGPERTFALNVIASALRTASQGYRVMVVQLLKGGIAQGPAAPRQFVEHLEWLRPAVSRVIDSDPTQEEREAVSELWSVVRAKAPSLDLLVIEEAGLAVQLGLIKEKDLLELLTDKPTALEMALTGPVVPESVVPFADNWTLTRSQNAPPVLQRQLLATTTG